MEVIEAAAASAGEECIVLLGRIARTRPGRCADAALSALSDIDDPRAAAIVAAFPQTPPR
jgi:hypothetical protein